MSLIKTKSELHEQMVTWRHYIHKHPELSFKEEMTSDFIASVLDLIILKCIAVLQSQE